MISFIKPAASPSLIMQADAAGTSMPKALPIVLCLEQTRKESCVHRKATEDEQ
jgi:hypothetical protein